ncbi:LysR family transcriptional regulator [Bosea sp. SSUT16]|jgi:DNA-binding transcriptional LysR family regulator|uniref:LysR family transcriptional regulator n=1 Tax=Bosea spartocytisi TaxID=2773451 RepID=A0A927E8E9_9HYPH|nr:LysR family transcriptional regulator [Bosea spartocytisi]MBD3846263.1 LysR family transcriptional regulator [Bosea spartocytisi]MCT4473447.1 LysR family transcriptional regulator [Bosea spartocytisi]
MTDFRSLELFYWVAELNSFSRAAERANTTQPSVSQRIAALEAELGVKLFERNARSISLTHQGRKLVQYAERFLLLRTEMLAEVGSAVAMKGIVRLGVSETIAQTWLSRFMERAHAVYPNIVIDLTVDVSPAMRDLLARGDLDLAFMLGPIDDLTMASCDLCAYSLAVIASPDMVLGEEPLSIAELRNFPMITYPKATAPYPRLREALNDPSLPPPRIFGNSSLTTIVQMTLDRIGVSVIPPVVVQRELKEGRLRIVKTVLDLPDLVFTAAFPLTLSGSLARPMAELAQDIARSYEASRAF